MGKTKATSAGSVRFFGTGAGWPSASRNHSAHLYTLGKASAIVDCGESLSGSFLRSGASYNGFDHIFLSHTHGDHVGGFFMFMQSLWLKKRTRKLSIHAPEDAIEPLQRMLENCYVFPELFGCKIEWIALSEGQPVKLGAGTITPWLTSHLDALKQAFGKNYRQSFQAYSFQIEIAGKRIGHSADIGPVEDLETLFGAPLDLLVCELAHFKPKDLFSYLAKKPLKKLVLTHVAEPFLKPETEALARRMLPNVQVRFAREHQEIRF